MSKGNSILIAHISDPHAGSQYFVSNLMSRTIQELNELELDAVLVTGDLTDEGFRQEFKTAKAFLDLLKCPNLMVVPGNHDSRHVGYLHFEEMFGLRNKCMDFEGLTIVGLDSSQPDLDDGRIGRERYNWIREVFSFKDNFKIVALHHHLIPVPGTGRERNIIYDAGDLLEVLVRCGVNLVLCGHKHVPYVWRLEDLHIINAGTVSSLRLRGFTKPCYNLIELSEKKMRVYRKYPFGVKEAVLEFPIKKSLSCDLKKPILREVD